MLKGFLHNKATALELGAAPTGNARAHTYADEPLVRMRNTAILPGSSRLDEMIAGVDDGYLLLKTSNGQADSTTEFMFGIHLGRPHRITTIFTFRDLQQYETIKSALSDLGLPELSDRHLRPRIAGTASKRRAK